MSVDLLTILKRLLVTPGDGREACFDDSADVLPTAIMVREFSSSLERRAQLTRDWMKQSRLPVIASRCVRTAQDAKAQGVHLSEQCPRVEDVREKLDARIWVGASIHDEAGGQRRAGQGADYLILGPVLDTLKGGRRVRGIGWKHAGRVVEAVDCPIVLIGGMNPGVQSAVQDLGAVGWAGIRTWIKTDDS